MATAAGKRLAKKASLRLREKELAPVLAAYRALPIDVRRTELPDASKAKPPRRPVPVLPKGGVAIRGFCTYLDRGKDKKLVRAPRFYYEQNPDRWPVETQNDMLWLTEDEWRSLVLEKAAVGDSVEASREIRQRFFETIGIDYMEGSVNRLATRESSLVAKVEAVDDGKIQLRLEGYARLGKGLLLELRSHPRSRGSEIRVLGFIEYDKAKRRLTRFDVVGTGAAWGNKMSYTRREVVIRPYPWLYGIACELVTGDTPQDRVPPYNLLHYGSGRPYFPEK